MTPDRDRLIRFLFERAAVRGELAHLDTTWQSVLQRHDFPPPLRQAMGELMAAAALLAATLKLNGALILQIQGSGPLSLLVVECSDDLTLRATAKWSGALPVGGLAQWVGDGRFVITLDPKNGKQAYQGIVPLEGDSVAEILQNYMLRSEQLETRLLLAADATQSAGLLLQKLPQSDPQDQDAWQRLGQLAATLTAHELLELPAVTLLQRLFHQEDLRVFAPHPVQFSCSCSRAKVADMLRMVGRAEAESVLAEQGSVEAHCEFCHSRYLFDAAEVDEVFTDEVADAASLTRH